MSEIPYISHATITNAIELMPPSGIAFRFDPRRYADDGMQRERGGYMVLVPGARPEEGGASTLIHRKAQELRSGVDYGLPFALPNNWWSDDREGVDRMLYHDPACFNDPDSLPVLSWAAPKSERYLIDIYNAGTRLVRGMICIARVNDFGPIPMEHMMPPITATLEDINEAHTLSQDPAAYKSLEPYAKYRADKTEAGRAAEVFYSSLNEKMLGKFVTAIASLSA